MTWMIEIDPKICQIPYALVEKKLSAFRDNNQRIRCMEIDKCLLFVSSQFFALAIIWTRGIRQEEFLRSEALV